MDRAKTIQQAQAILKNVLPPSEGCDLKTYMKYVSGVIAGEDISVRDLGVLLAYYECHAEDLVRRIARDRMGKG